MCPNHASAGNCRVVKKEFCRPAMNCVSHFLKPLWQKVKRSGTAACRTPMHPSKSNTQVPRLRVRVFIHFQSAWPKNINPPPPGAARHIGKWACSNPTPGKRNGSHPSLLKMKPSQILRSEEHT